MLLRPGFFPLFLLVLADACIATDFVRVAVISDINGRYGTMEYHQRVDQAVTRIIELRPDLVISTGDMIAGQRPNPKLQRAELEEMWRSFDRHVRQPLEESGIPLLMTPGNHDASAYPGYALERQAYAAYHRDHPPSMPLLLQGTFPFHYVAEFKNILLVSLDATASGPLPAGQLDWLASVLAASEGHRGIIVFGHLPLQPITVGRESDIITDPALEQLLQKAEITVYLSGHHHAYYPGRRAGINMLSVANLGGNQRKLVGTDIRTGFSFTMMEIGPDGDFGLTTLLAPDFERALAPDTLPLRIGKGQHELRLRGAD